MLERMTRRLLLALLMLLAFGAYGERAATQPDLSTPKKALKYFDQIGTDTHVDRATVVYAAKSDDEKKVAKAFAAVDLEMAKLRRMVTNRFDRDAGDRMVHALRDVTADDIDAATESIDGDKATVSGKYFDEPLPMVRVNGAWKISMVDVLSKWGGPPDELVKAAEKLTDAIQQTEDEVAADKYANVSLLERALKRRVKKIIGGD
jgi:hypothetical protein